MTNVQNKLPQTVTNLRQYRKQKNMEKKEIINQIKTLIKKKFDGEVSITELSIENTDRFFIDIFDDMFSRACFFYTDNIEVNYFIEDDDYRHPIDTQEDDYEKLSIEDLIFLAETIAMF